MAQQLIGLGTTDNDGNGDSLKLAGGKVNDNFTELYASSGITGRIVCNQTNKDTTLGGVIDSTKEYFLDGIIDMGTTQITVPTTGMTMRGMSFDISGLTSTENSYTMFISESIAIGSGNLLGQDYHIDVSGTSSKVYELYDATGFNAIEFLRVNYNNCTSLGDIYDYRQGLESGTGRFGGSPSLTFHGLWVGGFRITTSITRSMSDTTTEPLFKAGTLFQMNSRFLTDMNVDLGTLQPLLDFTNSNFSNTDTLQLQGMIVTRDGVVDATDSNITPNISETDLASQWKNNLGLHNTFVGGVSTVTVEVETVVTTIDTSYLLLGTQVASELVHFDAPSNGQLRLLGDIPTEYTVVFDFIIDGVANDNLDLELVKDDGGIVTVIQKQKRQVNALQGARDVAFFNGVFNVSLHNTDFLYWRIANRTGTGNCTLELDSVWHVITR
tara:strand:- start:2195 stop:3514 length:1320 start_codon:yes stop_codon:yes gene_type:complete